MWVRTLPAHIEQEFGAPDEGSPQTITLVEEEQETFTGLFDQDGNPLHKLKQPLGFIND